MNVFDALTLLKHTYQATPHRPALPPHNHFRQAVVTVAQAVGDLQSRCEVLEDTRESRMLALGIAQEQVIKSTAALTAMEAERDALATQLAKSQASYKELQKDLQDNHNLLQAQNSDLNRAAARAGQVSEEFRKDPQNHVKTWRTSYTRTVVAGLSEAWESAPPHSSARRSISYAIDLLADYHKTSHVVYRDRDAARAQRDNAAAELSGLTKALRQRVRDQLLKISSSSGTPAARVAFSALAPGATVLAEVPHFCLPGLLEGLARRMAPWPRSEVHIRRRVHVNLQNMPRKAVDGDLYAGVRPLPGGLIWLPAVRLNFQSFRGAPCVEKLAPSWFRYGVSGKNEESWTLTTTVVDALEDFIKALK